MKMKKLNKKEKYHHYLKVMILNSMHKDSYKMLLKITRDSQLKIRIKILSMKRRFLTENYLSLE